MAVPNVQGVRTFVRILYADGTAGMLMMPSQDFPATVEPTAAAVDDRRVADVIRDQSGALLNHFQKLGTTGVYEAAKQEAEQRRQQSIQEGDAVTLRPRRRQPNA